MVQEPDKTLLSKPFLRYWLATRPAFLAASLIPVLIGAAAVVHQGMGVSVGLLLLTLLATALVHAGVNVLNDYYDHENGTDGCNTQRVFPFTGGSRFIQNGVLNAGETFQFGALLLAVAILLGVWLAWLSGTGLLWIGVAGVLVGWGYSAPPLRLNSRGLGEPAVALGFGILTPLGAWFVQTGEMSAYPVLVSLPVALLVMNILFINQFPDHQADAASGKHHWVVRMGLGRAPIIYLASAALAALILLLLVFSGKLPVWSLLSLLPLALSFKAASVLRQHATQPALLEPALKMTIAAMMLHGVLLTLILWLV